MRTYTHVSISCTPNECVHKENTNDREDDVNWRNLRHFFGQNWLDKRTLGCHRFV